MIFNNSLWSTVSKAFEKSKNTAIVLLLLYSSWYISLVIMHQNPLKVSTLQSPKTISHTFTNSRLKLVYSLLKLKPFIWSNHISQGDYLKLHSNFKRLTRCSTDYYSSSKSTTFKRNHWKYLKYIKIDLKKYWTYVGT